ncbi:MAG: hypothetical protein HC783_08955, partial [Rhodobacteraceae bacterium]|nr:hypothetical protein [Paracoccaceae bacterium]
MKPMGAIPQGFAADAQGRLLIGARDCEALVAEAGDTPLFVYDGTMLERRVARLRAGRDAVIVRAWGSEDRLREIVLPRIVVDAYLAKYDAVTSELRATHDVSSIVGTRRVRPLQR